MVPEIDTQKGRWPFMLETRKRRRRALQEQEQARRDLEGSLESTRLHLAQAYAGFDDASDPELIESYVYEIQALKTRYSYLLRRRKALEDSCLSSAALPAL